MQTKEPEEIGEDESPIPLRSLGDVERALAKVIRQAHKKTMELSIAHLMIIGLGTLAKIKQDARDTRWQQRADTMWKERQAKADAQPKANH